MLGYSVMAKRRARTRPAYRLIVQELRAFAETAWDQQSPGPAGSSSAALQDGHSRYSHDRGDNEREREAGPRSGLLVVGRMQLLLCGHEWEVWVMDSSERVIRKA